MERYDGFSHHYTFRPSKHTTYAYEPRRHFHFFVPFFLFRGKRVENKNHYTPPAISLNSKLKHNSKIKKKLKIAPKPQLEILQRPRRSTGWFLAGIRIIF